VRSLYVVTMGDGDGTMHHRWLISDIAHLRYCVAVIEECWQVTFDALSDAAHLELLTTGRLGIFSVETTQFYLELCVIDIDTLKSRPVDLMYDPL
jgi:hypothetical protein